MPIVRFGQTANFGFVPRFQVLYEEQDLRRYQSGQPTVFSGAYIMTVLEYVYTWLILQFCGRLGPTGTFETQFRVQSLLGA